MNRALVVLVLIAVFNTKASAINLRLPYPAGQSWQVTVTYGGATADGTSDKYHTDTYNGYYAVDFAPASATGDGQPVLAAADGDVVFAGGDPTKGFGYYVKLDHRNGYKTLYGHMKEMPTVSGHMIQGQQIGRVGSTGYSTGTHVHFQLYYKDKCTSAIVESKPEPMSGFTNFRAGSWYTSDNNPNAPPPPPTYLAKIMYQSPQSHTLVIRRNQSVSMTARYANQGTATWTTATSDGHYVELRACDQYGHTTPSEFFVPTNPAKWIDATRVNTFDRVSEVPPIEEGTITFSIHMPPAASARSTNQYFGLFHRSDTEAMRMGVGGYDGMYEVIKRFAPYDFDGDGVSDVWDRTADGRFLIDTATPSLNGWDSTYYGYGGPLDTPCPADYDGDGKCDIAVLRNADRKFLIDYAKNRFGAWDELSLGGYGGAGDIPCPGDYDGDGTDDIAVRDADGDFHIDYASGGFGEWNVTYYGYGGPLDTPCPADYDGDGKCDIAVLRNADRKFLIDYSNTLNNGQPFGAWDELSLGGYGGAGDIPCPGDFDGDGKADPAVLWIGDRTLRIDYSGDGLNSWNAILGGYGGVGDRVMVGLFDFDGRDDIGVYHPASNQVCFDMYAYAGVPAWGSWDYCDNTHATAAPLKMQPVTPEPELVSLRFNCRVTPNPVQSGAVFQFDLPVRDDVTLSVFDLSGRLVTTVPTVSYGPGRHTVSWTNTPKQPSGLYFVRLTSRLHTATVKFAVVP